MFKHFYLLFGLLPFLIIYFYKKEKAIKFPSIKILKTNLNTKKYKIGDYLILLSLVFFFIAFARPIERKIDKIEKKGIDIALLLDISQSMLQKDIKPNRLEKAKEVLENFVDSRKNDRFALSVFAATAYTRIPLTFDYDIIKNSIKEISVDDISNNKATAIGVGLVNAINRLKKSKNKSKVIILITDGENNFGDISPEAALNIAKKLGMKIYTIGVGGEYLKINSIFGTQIVKNNEIDEKLLLKIAKETNGKFYRVKDEKEFEDIFKTINKLEKTKIESNQFIQYKERYFIFDLIGYILLILGIIFKYFIYIIIP
ncbi:Ca-activated chloride channel family protein [Hypnocyclicus thermotrophus]|uniref:Ca-activated chloride channel family protein n=1 Tax=Hypnocyclicus thermotrophus TaxID=1627895 RepID=A0AA46I6J3_9FUSO|nr:VWA domain-containing protein [Hypnocyclicus thermotrophus]TDT71846.1 Ca-activated chloride channel family protein [Hypnocyclicus thermotrophus]